MTIPQITVAIIEDQALLSAALEASLATVGDIDVVGCASSIDEGVALVSARQPDVVVTDYRLGDGDIGTRLGELRAGSPHSAVLVFTGWPDEQALLCALGAGARGFIDKSVSLDDFVRAIRQVAKGESVVTPGLLPALARRAAGGDDALSARELEVLQLLADGLSTAEVAQQLILSIHTVRNHVARLLPKLGARTRLEAVNEAIRRGLIRRDPLPLRGSHSHA